MIELNLLPRELRTKKKRLSTVKMHVVSVGAIVAGLAIVVVLTHLLLVLLVRINTDLSKTLEEKWQQIQPQRKRTEKLTAEISSLEKRVMAIREIAKPGLNWTKLLSGLNQAVRQNIWLSGLKLKFSDTAGEKDLPSTLHITGYALGKSEEATAYVGKFITSLKETKDFSEHFDVIELQDMKNRDIAGEEVMLFRMNCRFKSRKALFDQTKQKTPKKQKQ
jgi:cell division protein FtsB